MLNLEIQLGLIKFAVCLLYACFYKWGVSITFLGFSTKTAVNSWNIFALRIGKFYETNDYGIAIELFGLQMSKHFKRAKKEKLTTQMIQTCHTEALKVESCDRQFHTGCKGMLVWNRKKERYICDTCKRECWHIQTRP